MEVPSVTVEQMREVDRFMVEEYDVPLPIMMERAGRILAQLVIELHGRPRVSVLVGKGNNGGGGLVAARHLHDLGIELDVVLGTEELTGVPAQQLEALRTAGVPERHRVEQGADVLVDALLGYSAVGPPRGRVEEMISEGLSLGVPVVSLDVPSGLDLETGMFYPTSFRRSVVMTLGLPKENMVEAVDHMWVADIGIPGEAYRRLGIDVPDLFGEADHFRIS
jgi:NAD(P)H-hydrate epimerase